MSEPINTNQNPEQQPTTPTPEASGGQGEKLFTQDDVNRIVSDRLARERAKAEPSPEDEREADLKAREARMDCREFLSDKKYPADLLDILPTADVEAFKASVETLAELFQQPAPKAGTIRVDLGAPLGGNPPRNADGIANAFKPPKIYSNLQKS